MEATKTVRVSVIMPVYNSAKFLRETLDTVINQTLREIEIICVDDGSSDDSLDILKEYAQKDKRVLVVEQKNQYAGVARNNGLSKATGKYVIFWDSDDLFMPYALEKLYKRCEKDEADICVCGADMMDSETGERISSGVHLVKKWLPSKRPFSKEEMPEYIFQFATNVPWNKMFLRSFLEKNQLQFQESKQSNDTYFILMALFLAYRITYVKRKLMLYRIYNEKSLTGKASDTVFCSYEAYVKVLEEFLQNDMFVKSEELRKGFANRAIRGFFYSLFSQQGATAYEKLYELLVSQGFAKFDLLDKRESYFHYKEHYEYMHKMQTMQPEQFLLYRFQKEKRDFEIARAHIIVRVVLKLRRMFQSNKN